MEPKDPDDYRAYKASDDLAKASAPAPIYACAKSQYCTLPGRVNREGTGMHYHVGRLYPVMLNPAPRPQLYVAPIDREQGVWGNFREDCVVRFEVIRRA